MAISSFLNTRNLVIDFETGGRGADTLIVSVGLASWSLAGALIEGYWLVELDQPGRTMRADTMAWWMKTAIEHPEAAQSSFLGEPRFPLSKVLSAIQHKISHGGEYTLAAKPQDFDLPILEHAWASLGNDKELTHYRARHNARTLWGAAMLFDPDFKEEAPRVPHRADEDALAIALTCSKALQLLKRGADAFHSRRLLDELHKEEQL